MANDREDIIEILNQIVDENPRYRLGQMMGHRAVYVGRKIAVFAFDDGLAVKVPHPLTPQIAQSSPDCRPFAPMGSTMRGWVILSLDDAAEYRSHQLVIKAFQLAKSSCK